MFDGRLTTSFHSLTHPSYAPSYVYTTRSLKKPKLNPAQTFLPSSTLLNIDETGKFPEHKTRASSSFASPGFESSNSLLVQDNTIGIIGGASVNCTLKFLRKLAQLSSQDGEDCPPFVLCSDPILNKQLSSQEKGGKRAVDSGPIAQSLRKKRILLENSGARCIVMPCHISHSWFDEVSEGCTVPVLHMGDCVVRELKEAKLKPLEAGSSLRIGLLTTIGTTTAGIYKEKLQNEGFEVMLPDTATIEHTIFPAVEAINRKDTEGARNLLRIALQVLLVRAVNSIILASDDMYDLLPQDDPLLRKCIDPIEALARSTIRWTKSSA